MRKLIEKIKIKRKEKEKLNKIVNALKSEQRAVLRSNIILELVEGKDENEVASNLKITVKTVRKWRDRFQLKGLNGLKDEVRKGAPSRFTVLQRCEIIAIACDYPKNYGYDTHNHWTGEILTEATNATIEDLNISESSIRRTLKMNELRPHKFKMWLHSKDPEFKERVSEVIDLYLNSPKDAAVISIDEKTGMQAIERIAEPILPKPGCAGKYESEYIRHGTQSLIASFDIKTGKVIAQCGDTRTASDLLAFMEKVAIEYASENKIHVIWDNLNIHKDGANERWIEFNRKHKEKFEFHYTPKHASWVNQIEIFFSIVHRRCLKLSSFKSKEDLREMVMKFIKIWNDKEGHAFNWTFKGYPIQSVEKEIA
jgi:transposase